MSVMSLLVFDADRLPTLEQLSLEAERGGEPLGFGSNTDLRTHIGFLPVRAYGRETGFECYFEEIPAGRLPDEVLAFGSHHLITRTGSDLEEGRAALAFLKVAARLTKGAYVYPDDGLIIPPDQVDTYLGDQIEQYGKYIK